MIAEPMSAGARRKPNASALVGIVAAASVRATVDTTAILPNFSIMTRPFVYWRLTRACSLPTETSNKARAGISDRLSRDISRHGESETARGGNVRRRDQRCMSAVSPQAAVARAERHVRGGPNISGSSGAGPRDGASLWSRLSALWWRRRVGVIGGTNLS